MHRTFHRPAPLDLAVSSYFPHPFSRGKDVNLTYSRVRYPLGGHWDIPNQPGLRTPPADDMATTYAQSLYNGYSARPEGVYAHAEAPNGRYTASNGYHGSTAPSSSYSSASHYSSLDVMDARSVYKHASSPVPSSRAQAHVQAHGASQAKVNDAILPNLQIPTSINKSGGSLAEFAAQITCLFWFESMDILHKAERLQSSALPVKRLRDDAIPSSGFRKWVVTILSTTQVTQNVILLALLFIYRLKAINPNVEGRSGSEYRLLTVALMLGNKFLDDNTYTNKTWAEVSGISVTEIHVMEVEFLSNMRYSLLASQAQWDGWLAKLGNFWTYCDAATKIPPPIFSPLHLAHTSPALPSPPASMQASPPSLPHPSFPRISTPYGHHQPWSAATTTAPVLSPLASMPEPSKLPSRKRSLTSENDEPPVKRVTRPGSNVPSSYTSVTSSLRRDAPRLPVPSLTIATSQPMSYAGGHGPVQGVPVLPPLTGRAMSTVYPTTPTYPPQLPILTPTGPPSHHGGPYNEGGHGTPSRRQSPHSLHDLLAFSSSPISSTFPGSSSHASPSYFLQQRASPYRPVRHVNTLLYPPPSASMHDNTLAHVHQMHYQPLGKRNEYHEGVVPEYAPRSGQNSYQHWNLALPQPQFRG